MDKADNSVPGKKELKQRMWIVGIGLMVFQQMCGANTLIFYANEIFDEIIVAEVPSGKSQALSIAMFMIQVMCIPSNSRVLFVCTICTSPFH